ncbi:zinc-ribbon domain-containing protein [Candidatus Oscillochloris fontis]|uniref:zinc-ribbon domain-containing protein n=1 Tax=Candidatus Oscillochloris fontis TaxID=2496868 RepID=UPI00101CF870|nr:zinc-ribbon domain-containing protein [Candidatus Oscillochloris fontis]
MEKPCPVCGRALPAGSRFCISCGAALQAEAAAPPAYTGATSALGQRCVQPVGVLTPHRCDLPAIGTCRMCGQPFCDQHLRIEPAGPICARCADPNHSSSYAESYYYSSSNLDYFDQVSEDDRGEDFSDVS